MVVGGTQVCADVQHQRPGGTCVPCNGLPKARADELLSSPQLAFFQELYGDPEMGPGCCCVVLRVCIGHCWGQQQREVSASWMTRSQRTPLLSGSGGGVRSVQLSRYSSWDTVVLLRYRLSPFRLKLLRSGVWTPRGLLSCWPHSIYDHLWLVLWELGGGTGNRPSQFGPRFLPVSSVRLEQTVPGACHGLCGEVFAKLMDPHRQEKESLLKLRSMSVAQFEHCCEYVRCPIPPGLTRVAGGGAT